MLVLIIIAALVLVGALLVGLLVRPRPARGWDTTQIDDAARRALVERGGLHEF